MQVQGHVAAQLHRAEADLLGYRGIVPVHPNEGGAGPQGGHALKRVADEPGGVMFIAHHF